jgi:hypothetical protein
MEMLAQVVVRRPGELKVCSVLAVQQQEKAEVEDMYGVYGVYGGLEEKAREIGASQQEVP